MSTPSWLLTTEPQSDQQESRHWELPETLKDDLQVEMRIAELC